jgi:uncharacterized cupredoxin-like copper-binding protein
MIRAARLRRLAVAGLVAGFVTSAGYAYAAVSASADAEPAVRPLGPGEVTVRIGIEHSRFEPEEVHVVQGTKVRFLVDNGDPIGHELITGPPSVHRKHEQGSEARHPTRAGEVSVGPGDLAMTTYEFDDVGEFEFACHLPGHYAFGMHGVIVVEPAQG